MTTYVLDYSHWNTFPTADALKSAKVAGVIHKATQGPSYIDPNYTARFQALSGSGILRGAYHFGDGSDPIAQEANFARTVGSLGGLLVALDWEGNPNGPTMRLSAAEAFVQRLHDRAGRWPVLYTSAGFLSSGYLPPGYDGILKNCPLWLAAYRNDPPPCPPPWTNYVLWQAGDGIVGLVPDLPGVWHEGEELDVNVYASIVFDLKAWWGT